MSFQLDYYLDLYNKSYQEAVKAEGTQNYAVAYKKFSDTVMFARKLAALDPINKAAYLDKAARIQALAEKMHERMCSQTQGRQVSSFGAQAGNGSTSRTGSSSVSAQTQANAVDEDMSAFYTFYSAGDLVDGFDKVIGLDEAKQAITDYVINPVLYPEAYNYNFLGNKCILLEGPPGTGKTTFAKAVAKEIKQPFVLVNVASLINCYVGETGKNIDKIFASLRKHVEEVGGGITVFFDEFDEIAKSRGGDDKGSQTAVPALLRNLEGIQENKNFLILANTNCKELLDAGILSRFRRRIYIPLPDKEMRKQFFKNKLADLERDFFEQLDLDVLAEESDGLSGRAITQACDDFKYFVGGFKAGKVQASDLTSALVTIIKRQK